MGLKVLSLFDGISCGMVALERAGLKVDTYIAYEIEESAVKISKKNYPMINHCGDVFNTDFKYLKNENIDLLIGGSPCTFWSKSKCSKTAKIPKELDINGVGWNLFSKYLEALKVVKPKYFLYENNYGIPKNIEDEITKLLGVHPICINSNLFSAQNRKRLYWTNIMIGELPKSNNILIKDIIVEDDNLVKKFDDRIRNTMKFSKNYIKYDLSGKGHYSQQDRMYFLDSKAPTVPKCRTETKFNVYLENETYKKTCVKEIERLQTLTDDYTLCEGVSKTKRYEAIGNGWTIDVIAHIFRGICE